MRGHFSSVAFKDLVRKRKAFLGHYQCKDYLASIS
jgi:hypothetical protein